MSSSANTFGNPQGTIGTLNGLFKEVYAKKLKDLIPDGVKLLNEIEFLPKESSLGNLYHQPVILGQEQGITFAPATSDAFSLNAPIAGSIQDAQIQGNPAMLRSVLGLVAASRSVNSAAAFESASKYLVANMLRSMSKAIEAEMFYGTVGYTTVSSLVGTLLTPTTSEWAPGIWAGSENMPIEIRSADGSVSRGTASIASVDMSAQTLTLSNGIPGVIATDVVWRGGAYGNEFIGVHAILTQASGKLFNINVQQYSMFRGNTYSAQSAALSFPKLSQAAALAVEKGLDGKLTCFVNPRTWANLLTDQAALRKYDSSYSQMNLDNGAQKLTFYSQNGELEIVPSVYVKQGYAYMLALDDWSRVGSTDLTFEVPGRGDEFFRLLENAAGYQLSLYTDQAVFCSAPGKSVVITGIVNQQ